MQTAACVVKSEDNVPDSVLSFYHELRSSGLKASTSTRKTGIMFALCGSFIKTLQGGEMEVQSTQIGIGGAGRLTEALVPRMILQIQTQHYNVHTLLCVL